MSRGDERQPSCSRATLGTARGCTQSVNSDVRLLSAEWPGVSGLGGMATQPGLITRLFNHAPRKFNATCKCARRDSPRVQASEMREEHRRRVLGE
jgi:hypothetical protein